MALGLSQPAIASGIVAVEEIPLIEAGLRGPDQRVAAALCKRVRIPLDPSQPVLDVEHAAAIEIEAALRRGEWRAAREPLSAIPRDGSSWRFYSAFVQERAGDLTGAIRTLESALASPGISRFWRMRMSVALCRSARDAGDLERSRRIGEQTLLEKCDDPEMEIELRSTLAGTYCEIGDLGRALDLTEPRDSDPPLSPWINATRLWARAMALQSLGRLEAALEAANGAVAALRGINRPTAHAKMQNAAAWIAMQTPAFNPIEIDTQLRQAEAVFRELDAPVDLALVLSTRSELAVMQADVTGARDHAQEAVALIETGDAGERARIMAAAAHVYASIGDVDTAMRHLLTARELLDGSGARRSAAGTWQQMAATYAAMGQEDLRLACLRAAMDLLDL